MVENRIKAVISFGYKAINSNGDVTLELSPTTLTVSDQSPESASGHLVAIMNGLMAPAHAQVETSK